MKSTIFLYLLLVGMLVNSTARATEDNVHFSGSLVAQPCTLPETDTDIHVEFGSVIVKYLYKYQRTKSQPFIIHLNDCEPSVMKSVSVTFEGIADNELSSMLSLDPSSTAQGVAIGLEQEDGSQLAINKESTQTPLSIGNNKLMFYSFIQGKIDYLTTNKIVMGDFLATSTFVLNYQ